MEAIDQAAQTNANVISIPGTSFATAWKEYSSDFFLEMQGNLVDFLKKKIVEVQPYWASSAAVKDFTQAGATAVARALATKLKNINTNVVIDSSFVK